MQPASEEEKILFVRDDHYRREKNALCLDKWAIEAELNKKKQKAQVDYWSFNIPSSNEASPFLGNETFRLI